VSSESVQPEPAPGRGRNRWIALGAAAVLVSMAVGGGVGYVLLQYKQQPRPAARIFAAPPATVHLPSYGARSDGDHYGPLSDLLLPIPGGYTLGPDLPGVGGDVQLTPAQFVSVSGDIDPGATSSERKALVQSVESSHLEGYALRSYEPTTGGSPDYYLQIALVQENQHEASDSLTVMHQMVQYLGVDRSGPAVPGFPSAQCFLPYSATGDQLSSMECVAAVGDLFVDMQEDGTAPLDTGDAVAVFEQQLTRLAIPAAQI
jgi:hypothetical protein